MTEVWFSDPIPQALAHYDREFVDTLASIGATARPVSWTRSVEGNHGLGGRMNMLFGAGLNVAAAKRSRHRVMQAWPSLGLLEARLWSSRRCRHMVVLHDPRPIRPQFGHSKRAERWASRARQEFAPTIVVLSEHAYTEAKSRLPNHRIVQAMLPMMSQQSTRRKSDQPTVVVAGQYKTERDLDLLARLGPQLRHSGWRTNIVGRGWPEVEGWDVDARFVSEEELDDVLGQAWVQLMPYKNYYQSAIAVRALEMGTLTVGPRSSFLEDLYGPSSRLIVDGGSPEAYLAACERVARGEESVKSAFDSYSERTRDSWRRALGEL